MITLSKRKARTPFFMDPFFTNKIYHDYKGVGTPNILHNIIKGENGYELELAAPGGKREDFNIDISNGNLIISFKNEKQNETKYTHKEFGVSSFEKKFHLPKHIDVGNISASYEAGILKVLLPKSERPTVNIQIK